MMTMGATTAAAPWRHGALHAAFRAGYTTWRSEALAARLRQTMTQADLLLSPEQLAMRAWAAAAEARERKRMGIHRLALWLLDGISYEGRWADGSGWSFGLTLTLQVGGGGEVTGAAVWALQTVPAELATQFAGQVGSTEVEAIKGFLRGKALVLQGQVDADAQLIAPSKYNLVLALREAPTKEMLAAAAAAEDAKTAAAVGDGASADSMPGESPEPDDGAPELVSAESAALGTAGKGEAAAAAAVAGEEGAAAPQVQEPGLQLAARVHGGTASDADAEPEPEPEPTTDSVAEPEPDAPAASSEPEPEQEPESLSESGSEPGSSEHADSDDDCLGVYSPYFDFGPSIHDAALRGALLCHGRSCCVRLRRCTPLPPRPDDEDGWVVADKEE
jgi:hypothetical protein